MRVIRLTVDRHNEGVRVAVAMSPSLLAEVVENGGDVRFNSISDNDLALELELNVDALDPTEPEDEFLRMEFEREAEEYDPDEDCQPEHRTGVVLGSPRSPRSRTERRSSNQSTRAQNRRSVRTATRAHMCRSGALGGGRRATFCARVRCAG
jgi:hypothetical protein